MKKIPTIFKRDFTKPNAPITQEWHPDCLWVRDGEGVATRKWDGTSCLIKEGHLYKRREYRADEKPAMDFMMEGYDDATGKTIGWLPVEESNPNDRWHVEALAAMLHDCPPDGTYELVGPKVNGNKDKFQKHLLIRHGRDLIASAPRDSFDLAAFLASQSIEGIVWHHPDGRMAKIKRRDFGLHW